MRAFACAVIGLLVSAPLGASPAPFDGSRSIDAWNGLVVSFSRATGLAGAYVGVAEGQDGAVFNPAATAHRDRNLDRGWDWDFVLNWLIPGVSLPRQDLGDEGVLDAGLSARDSIQVGLEGQLGRLGVGVLLRGWSLAAPGVTSDRFQLQTWDAALSVGWSFWREQLVVGTDLAGVIGNVGYAPAGGSLKTVEYSAASHLRVGTLFKPRGARWRVGMLVDPGQTVERKDGAATLPGIAIPRAFAFPAVLSLGGSILLGRNARLYNEPPPVAIREHPEWEAGPAFRPGGPEPLMVTAQLDIVGATPGAVSPLSYLRQQAEAEVISGAHASVEPHLGVEWTALDRWLVVRGGSYLEPSRVGAPARLHATLGGQTRIPVFLDLRLAVAADVAARYSNVSVGIGLWHDLTPRGRP